MYTPKAFTITDPAIIQELVAENPLATLVAVTANGLEANHIPLHFDGGKRLLGHIARANTLWQTLADNASVLVIFQGPNHYISPSWLPSKQVAGKAVPTWDYVAVHMSGTLRFIHEADEKRALLATLTHQHEQYQAIPWQMDDAPVDYIDKLLNALVGFEVIIDSIQAKAKVSQNKTADDREANAQVLDAASSPLMPFIAMSNS